VIAETRKNDMTRKRINLYDLESFALVVEYASGVTYENQVGGVVCALEEIEGVLSPLDIGTDDAERISTCPFLQGALGISPEIADTIDAILATKRSTSFMKVNRSRLHESQEAWVHVLLDTPADDAPGRVGQFKPGTYFGPIFGFGASRGVLTWPNSD
jgi:hypothetical protein